MALLPVVEINRAGVINPVFQAAAAGGDTVQPDNDLFLHVKNGAGVTQTVTVTTPGTPEGLALADSVVAVPAGGFAFIGPIDPGTYGRSPDGLAAITYSAVVTLTIQAVKLSDAD